MQHTDFTTARSTNLAAGAPTDTTPGACCGGPAPAGGSACCAQDAEARTAGAAGCGCASTPPAPRDDARPRSGCCS